MYFVFCGMNIDVNVLRIYLQRHVHEGVAALRQVRAVHHLDGLFDGRRVNLRPKKQNLLKCDRLGFAKSRFTLNSYSLMFYIQILIKEINILHVKCPIE